MDQSIFAIGRPHENLMKYYFVRSLSSGPALPVMLTMRYFRYRTMRYRIDEEGISMGWGVLFRHEIMLNYSRIQDVHLKSNVVERWLGLARIEIQTASGGESPEMTLEGLLEHETVRDFLYSRMRGAREEYPAGGNSSVDSEQTLSGALQSIAAELRGIRRLLEERSRV